MRFLRSNSIDRVPAKYLGQEVGQALAVHPFVGDADDRDTRPRHGLASFKVGCSHLGPFVDSAVDFDDQGMLGAIEVGDEAMNHFLTAEFQPWNLSSAPDLPGPCFRFGGLSAELLGPGELVGFRSG
jgi:hypothetical protein